MVGFVCDLDVGFYQICQQMAYQYAQPYLWRSCKVCET